MPSGFVGGFWQDKLWFVRRLRLKSDHQFRTKREIVAQKVWLDAPDLSDWTDGLVEYFVWKFIVQHVELLFDETDFWK